jgi:hypothetical protein
MNAPSGILALLLLALTLGACGGGDDDGSGDGTSISLDETTVTREATPADAGGYRSVIMRVRNPPVDDLYGRIEVDGSGVEHADFYPISDTEVEIGVTFESPARVSAGVHTATLTVHVCLDSECNDPVRGSPLRITTRYTVTAPTSVSMAVTDADVIAQAGTHSFPRFDGEINVVDAVAGGPYLQISHLGDSIQHISPEDLADGRIPFNITFSSAQTLPVGVHEDTVTIKVCYETDCERQVAGSPLLLHTRYTVTNDAQPEPGAVPLEVSDQAPLSHDVVDAEYSATFDAVVMASKWPQNALYVYRMASSTETSVALSSEPMSVSVSPDGLSAVVGHDGNVSYVADLATVGQMGAPAPVEWPISIDAYDIVLDGNGRAHAFTGQDAHLEPRSIDLVTGNETLGSDTMYGGLRVRLRPSDDSIYGAYFYNFLRFELGSGAADRLWEPGDPEHSPCGNLWFSETGTRAFSACGSVHQPSATQADDLAFAGSLPLSGQLIRYQIVSLSESAETHEVATLEHDAVECGEFGEPHRCYNHLNLYDGMALARESSRSLAPIEAGDRKYAQRGLFVFHSADGSRRYLLSRLFGVPDPQTEYFIGIVE